LEPPTEEQQDAIFRQDTISSDGLRFPIRWVAPEVFDPNRAFFHRRSDVWSLAIVVGTEMLNGGDIPFSECQDEFGQPLLNAGVMEFVLAGGRPRLNIPSDFHSGKHLHALLHRCWQNDPVARPSYADVGLNFRQLLEQFGTAPEETFSIAPPPETTEAYDFRQDKDRDAEGATYAVRPVPGTSPNVDSEYATFLSRYLAAEQNAGTGPGSGSLSDYSTSLASLPAGAAGSSASVEGHGPPSEYSTPINRHESPSEYSTSIAPGDGSPSEYTTVISPANGSGPQTGLGVPVDSEYSTSLVATDRRKVASKSQRRTRRRRRARKDQPPHRRGHRDERSDSSMSSSDV
jgi:serine/threonine protein kinase